MSGNEMICHCKQVDYMTIRRAMIDGCRTFDEIQEATGAGTGCGGCQARVEEILASVCGCNGVSLMDVVDAVDKGAKTVEEVNETTKAGTTCARCNVLIEKIIEQGR